MPERLFHHDHTVDKVLANELKSRGINSSTGVYGDHKLQIGNGEPIALDKIPSNSVPGEGWSQATKIARGTAGLKSLFGLLSSHRKIS